jgi:hypothetical protein
MTVFFDTLKFVRQLKKAGVPEAQAEAFAEAFKEAQSEADLATKQDLRELEERLTAKLYQALLVQTLTLAVLLGALKFFT